MDIYSELISKPRAGKSWDEMIWADPITGEMPSAAKEFEFDFNDAFKPRTPITDPAAIAASYNTSGWDFGKMFNSENIGSTLGNIGTAISGLAAVYNAYMTKKYQDKLFDMEKKRVDEINRRQKAAQENYEKSTGW